MLKHEEHVTGDIAPLAFQLPDATYVGAVHLQVSHLQQSLEYYEHVVGLRALGVSEDTATLVTHGDDRPLVILRSRPGVTRSRRGAFGLYHFAILLPDRAALGRFAAHLSAFDVRVGMADHRVSEALYLWDPDGLGIEVYADRPRETWQYRNGELMMTTKPLDIATLIAASGGERWTGAPRGTTIGHLHLHVGSLEDAEAFYHRALVRQDRVELSRRLVPVRWWLSPSSRHKCLGSWTGAVRRPGTAPRVGTDRARRG